MPNSIMDLKNYLNTSEKPLDMAEFNNFWKSLTDEEKEEFKNMKLPKDK